MQVLSAFGTKVGDQVDADQVILICGYDQVCVHFCHMEDAELANEHFFLKKLCQINCLVLVEHQLLGLLTVKVKLNLCSSR